MNRAATAPGLPVPGIRWGDYPERDDDDDHPAPWRLLPASPRRYLASLETVRLQAARWRSKSVQTFGEARRGVQAELVRDGMTPQAVARCCGYVVEAARRALQLAAYDSQILAALAMLDNHLAEMATGEGKSLAAALAAAVGALAGMPVHVLTANDYLVARDAETFQPLYQLLGLGAAPVLAGQSAEIRRAAYAQPIVYVTASELAFDYLRDRLFHGTGRSALQRRASALADAQAQRPLLRGLCMAVIDEADNILIDEAQVPLVLSRERVDPNARAFLWQAYALSGKLAEPEDFVHLRAERRVMLTDTGREHIAQLAQRLQPVWKNTQHREDTIVSALTARHVFQRDRDYVVGPNPDPKAPPGDEVRIVDAVSGRIAEGRKWSRGLHALVAIKENVRVDAELETLAQITFQRFFRRYHRCGGMSGSLRESRAELRELYRLPIVCVPLRQPSRRRLLPTRVFADDAVRWPAVVARVRALRALDRPVLIGTDSVADSQALSRLLAEACITHTVLNANNDRQEAQIIEQAGRPGQVTVSTNMAGRGTDIHLDGPALQAGGLHVLCCQHNASRRHDRQLAGRAGRQGEPGSSEAWLSLASPRFTLTASGRLLAAAMRWSLRGGEVRWPARLLDALWRLGQRGDEARQARRRGIVCRHEREAERQMSFAAPE